MQVSWKTTRRSSVSQLFRILQEKGISDIEELILRCLVDVVCPKKIFR